jgi:hypothetical protein
MPLTQEQQDNINSFLHQKAEEEGVGLSPDSFPVLIYKYWDDVTNPQRMFRQAKRKTLRQLRTERDRHDTNRPAMDAEIAALEAEVGP